MADEFKCPSCSAPMTFGGGDSIFQTCPKCHAPIVVPSEIYYTEEQQIDAEDFATLAHDKTVSQKQVSLDVGAGEVANDDEIEKIINNPKGGEFVSQPSETDFSSASINNSTSQNVQSVENKKPSDEQINQLNYLINQRRKDEAVRFYQKIYNRDVHLAEEKVEKMLDQVKINKKFPSADDDTEIIIARIENALADGNKINAIKIFLDSFDAGLKESKEIVDAMESGRKVDISGFQRR